MNKIIVTEELQVLTTKAGESLIQEEAVLEDLYKDKTF